ncbi:hypothetical protein CP97_05940 [Aurantiacibacter atlanticus]|uniref:Uncharacterized protein n=1 Tax=Aurantiacibacter atlanticus TaxID=1648404 RepID=A0A0H4VAM2_9SPHN|nr:hypothetical protein [Aurantiacibacter atlanticus]AKQ41662.1 hypothetical protein CP97_05940 [Aurantiacibacter atlanticus]MDF1833328.1 hypothetical protein [Alteraurantiacibacter sp. bin_em_oilr2.035]
MGSSAISEGKSFASLGPMLLARKGTAKPAMRAQLGQSDRMAMLGDDFDMLADSQDALGWNDLSGHDSNDDVVALPVTNKRHARKAAAEDAKNGNRAAFTLRLDTERHLKLRLASTMQDCSAQKLVTEALDRFLDELPEIDAIAAKMRRKSTKS